MWIKSTSVLKLYLIILFLFLTSSILIYCSVTQNTDVIIKDYRIELIKSDCYHGDEVSLDWANGTWIGIFQNKNGDYYVDTTSLKVTTACDYVLEEPEDNPSEWTATCIAPLNTDTSLFLIKNIPFSKSVILDRVIDSLHTVYPSSPFQFYFFDKKYTLYADADSVINELGEEIVVNYSLYLKGCRDKEEIIQKIFEVDEFNYNMITIEFVGDIDQDGYPDFLINTAEHYNVYQPTLFLSTFATERELVKQVALHRSVGC